MPKKSHPVRIPRIRKPVVKPLKKLDHIRANKLLIAALRNNIPKQLVDTPEILDTMGGSKEVNPLISLTRHRSTQVRTAVAETLGSLGNSNSIPYLIRLLGDRHHDVFKQAQASLEKIGEPTIMPLTAKLHDEHEQIRRRSGEVLVKIGVDAADNSLLDALRDQDWHVRASVASSMHASDRNTHIEGLIAALKDPSFRVRDAAATSLGDIYSEMFVVNPDAPINALFALLEKEHEPARKAAAVALLKIATKYGDLNPNLVEVVLQGLESALMHSNPHVRCAVVAAIRRYLESNDISLRDWSSVSKLITPITKKPDPDPFVHAANLRVLKLIDDKFPEVRSEPKPTRALLFDDVGFQAFNERTRIIKAAKVFLATAAEAVPSRYADFTFHTDEPNPTRIPEGYALRMEQWYQLEVAVRAKRTGISPEEGAQRPILEPTQQGEVTIMVAAEYEGCEITEPVQTLILPPYGDSTKNAYFRILPLHKSANREDLVIIRLRLYYEFNLLEVASIKAEVVSKFDDPPHSRLHLKRPISFKQERLEHEYLDFDNIKPRAMHIDVTRKEDHFQFNFAFYNKSDKKIIFSAPVRLAPTDLEDNLINVRKIWYDIALSKTYSPSLEGDKNEFITNIRRLAEAGHALWINLFKLERASALFQVGKWLESHPLEPDGIVQVTTDNDAASFVFPWSLMYDRPLPSKKYELPDLHGFWGIRYCVEQNVPAQFRGSDTPAKAQKRLKMEFMLWKQFRNATQQEGFLENLQTRSAGKLDLSKPPITDADECFKLLADCDSDLLYFYTHGYTRNRKVDIGVGTNLDLFISRYERLEPDSPLRETYQLLYESIKQKQFEPDQSWIELTTGRIYLNELYDQIEFFKSKPFVFLNMCESAQVTPSLRDSFIHFFLDRGAQCVIGTECPMTVEFAHPFAKQLLTGMLEGRPVGKVLIAARRRFLEQSNPLGLAYSLFGSATACIEPPVIGG